SGTSIRGALRDRGDRDHPPAGLEPVAPERVLGRGGRDRGQEDPQREQSARGTATPRAGTAGAEGAGGSELYGETRGAGHAGQSIRKGLATRNRGGTANEDPRKTAESRAGRAFGGTCALDAPHGGSYA